ncbi:unnamed protein product [Amaranthus hypochondriacus]
MLPPSIRFTRILIYQSVCSSIRFLLQFCFVLHQFGPLLLLLFINLLPFICSSICFLMPAIFSILLPAIFFINTVSSSIPPLMILLLSTLKLLNMWFNLLFQP